MAPSIQWSSNIPICKGRVVFGLVCLKWLQKALQIMPIWARFIGVLANTVTGWTEYLIVSAVNRIWWLEPTDIFRSSLIDQLSSSFSLICTVTWWKQDWVPKKILRKIKFLAVNIHDHRIVPELRIRSVSLTILLSLGEEIVRASSRRSVRGSARKKEKSAVSSCFPRCALTNWTPGRG